MWVNLRALHTLPPPSGAKAAQGNDNHNLSAAIGALIVAMSFGRHVDKLDCVGDCIVAWKGCGSEVSCLRCLQRCTFRAVCVNRGLGRMGML
jgi:hypothetical protein